MRLPSATYRIQFNPSFTFHDAEEIIDYLQELGISDLYASPIFKARKSSPHGYDVTDPNRINPDLGGQEGFERLVNKLKSKNMGWLQDIVPNHMAYDQDNWMLMDVLEKGKNSPCFDFFDISWHVAHEEVKGKLLAPFLSKPYQQALKEGQIKIG
jgi:(1->4)-alpha-D-glucan 1-alpha-D-glucosylmutase